MEFFTKESLEFGVTILIGILVGAYKYFSKKKSVRAEDKVNKYENEAGNRGQTPLTLGVDDHKALINTVSYLVDHSKMTDSRMILYEEEKELLLTRIYVLEEQITLLEESSLNKDKEIYKLKEQRRALVKRLTKLEKLLNNSKILDTGDLIIKEAHNAVLLELNDDKNS